MHIAGDRHVHRLEALKVLVIRFQVHIGERQRDGLDVHAREATVFLERIGDAIELAPGIGDFEHQDHVRFADEIAAQVGLVQVMRGRKIHARAEVDHRRIQCFGKTDQTAYAFLVAHGALDDDDGRFGIDEQLGRLGQGTGVAL